MTATEGGCHRCEFLKTIGRECPDCELQRLRAAIAALTQENASYRRLRDGLAAKVARLRTELEVEQRS